jgi:hypothetical protein
LLVTIGGLEGNQPGSPYRYAFGGLAEQVAAAVEARPKLSFELIPGGDHQYTGVTDQLWSAVERWLAGS